MSHVFGIGWSVYITVYATNAGSSIVMRSPFIYLKTSLSEHSDSVKSIRIPDAQAVRLGNVESF